MPYAFIDANGKIAAVYAEPVEGAVEVAADDPALKAFLAEGGISDEQREQWIQSDLAMSRVLEDLIDVLIEKKVFMFTDLPDGAQKKLLERRGLRKEFTYVEGLFGDGSDYGPNDQNNQGGGGFL